MRKSLVPGVLGVLLGTVCAGAADLYVSPTGKPEGPGTKEAPYDVATALGAKSPAKPGDTVWLLGGVYVLPLDPTDAKSKRFEINCTLKGTPDKPIIVRQAPGERATIDGSIQINGADTWYWGFEVRGTRDTDRASGNNCINVNGPRAKMINMVVHRGAMGSGFWTPAVDAEQYGNLIFDFGNYDAATRGHGHASYTQNLNGTKRIVDNIMFAGHGWGIHAYTQGGQITGYHIEGNIIFSSGMASPASDGPKDNIIIAGYVPADRFTLVNNITYQPRTGASRWNVRLGTYKAKTNGAAVLTDNYFMGYNGLCVSPWLKVTASGNEIWGTNGILTLKKGEGAKDEDWQVNKNTYLALPTDAKFNGKPFADYQKATGFDADSKLVPTVNGRPTGTRTFVRPNKYEPGRANIAVFNWDGKDKVDVSLEAAGLKKGDKFQVRNVLDLFGKPVAEGAYDGKPVTLPMMKAPVAPDFDAFLLIPEASFGNFAARGEEPKMDWTKNDWAKNLK